jgi:outer membrane immunogenic protein
MPVKAPRYAPFSWAGFYIGANGGYGWSTSSDQLGDLTGGRTFQGLSPKGGFAGGQWGYNWQAQQVVFGLESDLQWSDIRDTGTNAPGGGVVAGAYESRLRWFGTSRIRLGLANDRTLIYGTAGLAAGRIRNDVFYATLVEYNVDRTAYGYVLGGGVEWAWAANWSVKAEYQWINLKLNDPILTTVLGIAWSSFPGATVREDAFHTVRLGVNYRW